MPWYAVYEAASGRLESIGTRLGSRLKPGLESAEVGEDRPDPRAWDETTRRFIRPVPPEPRLVPFGAFLERFQQAERIALRTLTAANDNARDVFELWQAHGQVDLAAQDTDQKLQFLVARGVLTPQRKAEILA